MMEKGDQAVEDDEDEDEDYHDYSATEKLTVVVGNTLIGSYKTGTLQAAESLDEEPKTDCDAELPMEGRTQQVSGRSMDNVEVDPDEGGDDKDDESEIQAQKQNIGTEHAQTDAPINRGRGSQLISSQSRLPSGYGTIEDAEQALTNLLQTSNNSEQEDDNLEGMQTRQSLERSRYETAQASLFSASDARSTRYEPDTAIGDGFRGMIRQTRRVHGQLNELHMELLQRQAEILQLRMSTVSSLMELQSTTNSIQKAVSEIEEHRVLSSSENRQQSSAMAEGVPSTELHSQPVRTTPHKDLLTSVEGRTNSSSSYRFDGPLSMSIHTIYEDVTSHDGSSTATDTHTPQHSTSDGSSPPVDRWDAMVTSSSSDAARPSIETSSASRHVNYSTDIDDGPPADQCLFSNDFSLSRWSSFPIWSPTSLQSKLERSSKMRSRHQKQTERQTPSDDMYVTTAKSLSTLSTAWKTIPSRSRPVTEQSLQDTIVEAINVLRYQSDTSANEYEVDGSNKNLGHRDDDDDGNDE